MGRRRVPEGDTGAVYLAENRPLAPDLRDQGGLAETQLAQALAEAGVARDELDPTHSAGRELAEGKAHDLDETVPAAGTHMHRGRLIGVTNSSELQRALEREVGQRAAEVRISSCGVIFPIHVADLDVTEQLVGELVLQADEQRVVASSRPVRIGGGS